MEPFLAHFSLARPDDARTASDKHDGWIIIDSMSSPIYRSIPEG